MPSVTIATLELGLTGGQVKFIMDHKNLIRRQLVKPHKRTSRLAGTIHEGRGFCQDHQFVIDPRLGNPGKKGFVLREAGSQIISKMISQPETCIVARGFILWTRISQPNDQTYRCTHEPNINSKNNEAPNRLCRTGGFSEKHRMQSRCKKEGRYLD